MVLDGKSSQEYLPDNVICDDTTLYSKCDQASNVWQQLELASELEPDLRDTLDWGKKWFVDFSAGKIQLVSFDQSNNSGSNDVTMVVLFLRKNHLLRWWG